MKPQMQAKRTREGRVRLAAVAAKGILKQIEKRRKDVERRREEAELLSSDSEEE
jgi:hypothetical protein